MQWFRDLRFRVATRTPPPPKGNRVLMALNSGHLAIIRV